jgi:hypothetical protein
MRHGINKMLLFGLSCIFVAGVSVAGFEYAGYMNAYVIMPPVMLLLLGASTVFPNASAGIFQPFPKIAGIASAIFYSTRILGGALFSGLLALMPTHSQLPMGIAFIASALLAIIIFNFTILRNKI